MESHECGNMKEALAEYLDGDVDSELCRDLKRHLEHCEDCRVVVDTARRTIRFYSQKEPVDVPQDVLDRLQQRLRSRIRGGGLPPG